MALLFFLYFSRDMPIIDVTFANRDGLGTRKHALVTHHVVLHDSLLRAIYCGLVVFFQWISGRFPSLFRCFLETFFLPNCNHGLVVGLVAFLKGLQRQTGRKRSDKKAKLLRSVDGSTKPSWPVYTFQASGALSTRSDSSVVCQLPVRAL